MLNELDWPELLKSLSTLTASQKARALCRELNTLSSPEKAFEAAEHVIEAQLILSETQLPDLAVIDLLEPVLNRLSLQAVLDVKELIVLRQFFNGAIALKIILKQAKSNFSDLHSKNLADFKSQLAAVNHVVAPDGEINENASPTLAHLSEERRRLARDISRTLDQIVLSRRMETVLQDKFVTNREGRMVIPVKSGSQHDVKGLIHDASQTKQTVFMEPEEVIPMNNRLREVQILIQEEIARILKELSDYLARFQTEMKNGLVTCLECDVTFAKARLNQKIKGSPLTFSKDGLTRLHDLRHPLLVLQGVDVVPNDVVLDHHHRILLLSGPNAGGKTILLKAIGLAAQMARCGLPVPVREEGSRLPFFKTIDAIIGDLQSVDQNLSSFSSHMVRLKNALSLKGPQNLLLVDEICGATDPEEGAALARSFIESFCHQEMYAVITSHLGPLKENWEPHSGVQHGSLEFNSKTNLPTFQLLLGFPGRSLALSVAQRWGVPTAIIERAKSFLSPSSQKRLNELSDIENLKAQIFELKNETQKDRDEAKQAKTQYLDLVKKFREQRDRWLEKALEKAQKRIENLIEEARLERLKNRGLHELKNQLPEIVKARTNAPSKPQTVDEFKTQFPPGTPAFSTRLGRQVLVQSAPDSKGQVNVLADSMRIQLPWHGLVAGSGDRDGRGITENSRNSSHNANAMQVIRRPSSAAQSEMPSEEIQELDLRGKRVDDALALLEKWLDDRMGDSDDRVKIIHGFGTEQLKKAVRQFLSKSRYVSKWTPGDAQTGGDGITWVTLAD